MGAPKPWCCKVLPAGGAWLRAGARQNALRAPRLPLKSVGGFRFPGVWDVRVTAVLVQLGGSWWQEPWGVPGGPGTVLGGGGDRRMVGLKRSPLAVVLVDAAFSPLNVLPQQQTKKQQQGSESPQGDEITACEGDGLPKTSTLTDFGAIPTVVSNVGLPKAAGVPHPAPFPAPAVAWQF